MSGCTAGDIKTPHGLSSVAIARRFVHAGRPDLVRPQPLPPLQPARSDTARATLVHAPIWWRERGGWATRHQFKLRNRHRRRLQ